MEGDSVDVCVQSHYRLILKDMEGDSVDVCVQSHYRLILKIWRVIVLMFVFSHTTG